MDWFKQIVDSAPDAMVVVDRTGIIHYANFETERLFGYARSELIGEPHEILMPERFRGAHSAHAIRFLQDPKGRPMGVGRDLVGLTKDGREIPIEVSLSLVHTADGLLVATAIRDIAARKRLEDSVRRTSERLSAAIEAIEDPIVIIDPDDRLVAHNSAYLRLHGAKEPLLGRGRLEMIRDLMPKLLLDCDEEEAARRFAGLVHLTNPVRELRLRDGRVFRLSLRRTADGGVMGHFSDITGDMRAAEELREAKRIAEAASAAKSEFLSSMSHELRTPFNAILGFAQLLYRDRREPLSQRQRERVSQILKGADHLLHLIDDVLDFSRIESGRILVSIEPVALTDALDDVIAGLRPAAERAGVRIERGPLPEGVATILADRTRFVQVLFNYGVNAVKYNRPGGSVRFEVSAPAAAKVRVTVADTGIGIPVDKQDRLFQPFQRAGQEAGPIEGTGIGLVISKRLVELMNGAVGFRSVPDEGSEFWLDLPVNAPAARPSAPRSPGEARPSELAWAARSTVLYIEDNPANVAFMRDLLESHEDVELITAATAEIGLEMARTRLPRVILMDINLPGMSGIDALRILRAWPETKDIPVIALTAAALERDRRLGEAAGFYRYLAKPVKIDELENALERVLRDGSAPGE